MTPGLTCRGALGLMPSHHSWEKELALGQAGPESRQRSLGLEAHTVYPTETLEPKRNQMRTISQGSTPL